MMKTLLLMLVAVSCLATPAFAQDTISLFGDDGSGNSRFMFAGTAPFDIVTVANTSLPGNAIEFVQTELTMVFPGLLKINTVKINDTPLDLGDNAVGEYLIAYTGCEEAGSLEIVRVTYLDLDGVINGNDIVLSLRGFQPGDSRPSSFEGAMGYSTCAQTKQVLTPERWSELGMPDVAELAGAAVLNPTWLPVPIGDTSFSSMKSWF